MPKPKTKKDKTPIVAQVMYPEVEVTVAAGPDAVTAANAKDLLGWEEVLAGAGKDVVPLLKDENGKSVRCTRNWGNRPLRLARAYQYAQDVLKKNWRFNGESIVIGKTGRVLSGQHRLIGLVLADQMWHGKEQQHWTQFWPTPPTMETVIVYGVEEGQDTVRTLDNVMERTIADVLFTDEELFSKYKGKDRETVCRMAEYAIRMLWDRVGEPDAFSPYRTHSEMVDFLARHQTHLVKALTWVYTENREGRIAYYVSPGYAAALLFLMACSDSSAEKYHATSPSTEKQLDWKRWDRAVEYWGLLAMKNPALSAVRLARRPMAGDTQDSDFGGYIFSQGEGGGSLREKMCVLIQGWNLWKDGKKLKSPQEVEPQYKLEWGEDGKLEDRQLVSNPRLGGIDVDRRAEEEEADEEDTATPPDINEGDDGNDHNQPPAQEEIEEKKKPLRPRPPARDLSPEEERKFREELDAKQEAEAEARKGKRVAPTNGEKPKRATRPGTRKAVQEEQTRKAAEADAALRNGGESSSNDDEAPDDTPKKTTRPKPKAKTAATPE